jgi:hypothetical protein
LSTQKEKGGHYGQNVAKNGFWGRNTPFLGTKIGWFVKKPPDLGMKI